MKVQNPAFRDIYETNSILWYNHLKHTTTEKYDNNGTASDLMMITSYKYILSIT